MCCSYPVGLDIIFYQQLYLLPYFKFVRSDGSWEILMPQGAYRQVCVKFKDFSRTSKDFPTVFKVLNFIKNTNFYVKILFLKCYTALLKI